MTTLCRLCADPCPDTVNIYSTKGLELCLPEKINKCLPIVISEHDSLTKDVCSLCQNKLEFCRQYFEQIYNAHVKLLGILREEEPYEISFEEQILHFVRSYSDGAGDGLGKRSEQEQPREVVKCEPEVEFADEKPKKDSKHFLDDLLDEYDDSMEAVDLKTTNNASNGVKIIKKKPMGLKKKKKSKCLVPPPLKRCSECNLKSLTHKDNLDHWTEAHPGNTVIYKCDWEGCNHTSTQVIEVKRHRRKHLIEDNQLVKCKDCDKYYPPKYLQTRHVLVHQEGKNFKCDVCEKGFKTVENLKVHVRTHGPDELKYTHCCELCGRRFTQKANLEAHMRTHTGQRPFGCDFCSKSFSQKGNLDEHRRTHTGEKPYVCDICGSRHTRKGELLLHIRCIHTHERPFQCAFCPKNFQRRDLLRKHERIHTDTRPYGCEFCGKTFTARDKMIVHRRLHTGERPYVCDSCGRGFCESGNLKKHMRVHGTDIPAVVKQNNKGKPAADPNKTVDQEAGVVKKRDLVVTKQEPVVVAEEDGGQHYQSPDSVKTEMEESGGVVYRRVGSIPVEVAEGTGGYLVGVPGQQYPQIVQHQLFHQIQSNWTAMYSQMHQHPPQ